MKRSLLLILAIVLFWQDAAARYAPPPTTAHLDHFSLQLFCRKICDVPPFSFLPIDYTADNTHTRLKKAAWRMSLNGKMTLIDSDYYVYNSTSFRILDNAVPEWGYDSLKKYHDTSVHFPSGEFSTKTYLSNNNMAAVQTLAWELDTPVYSGNDIVAIHGIDHPGSPSQRPIDAFYTYDAAHNLLGIVCRSLINGNFDTLYRASFTYNSNNQLLTSYEENSINLSLKPIQRSTSTYNAYGTAEEIYEEFSFGTWQNETRLLYTYNAGGKCINMKVQGWQSGWQDVANWNYSYNAAGRMDSSVELRQINGNIVTATRYKWTYNNYGQVTQKITEQYDAISNSINTTEIADLYYESPSTGIATVSALKDMKLYPNPAGTEVNIELTAEAANVKMLICNTSGIAVYSTEHAARNQTINISAWAPGIYFVKCEGQPVMKLLKN